MHNASTFREIISGQRSGLAAAFARGVLNVLELPYSLAISWRNRRFDRGRSQVMRVAVPVISVGNLTTGGTGKTPMVEWLARWLAEQGLKAAIVSRGYGAKRGEKNDEALELAIKLPQVPHLQNPRRVVASQAALDQFHAQVIVLDDGFQHRRLHRDLDIVLLDALEPFGYDHLLPRGLLREPIENLKRAHVVALSRADLVSADRRAEIQNRVQSIAPNATWIEVAHVPTELWNCVGKKTAVSELRGKRIAAFCGIGNPLGFRRTLENLGCEIVAWREFPDHHRFNAAEKEELGAWCQRASQIELAVCTLKDLVKLQQETLHDVPLQALAVQLQICRGEAEFVQALAACRRPA